MSNQAEITRDADAEGTQDAGAELPRWTRVAAYGLTTDDAGRVLLVRVAPDYPAAGRWTLPGGGLTFGEDPQTGVLRELTEETGLTGAVESLAFVDSRTGPARPERGYGEWHGIRIVYRVRITGGELRDESDESTDRAAWSTIAEARLLPLGELAEVALDFLGKG
jgi:ADP-ribose pyrophosphatase YjhB (NUDIX family)